MSNSSQDCSSDVPGPKILFYKLVLEGKILNILKKYKFVQELYRCIIYLFLGNDELANFIIRGVLVTIMALFGMVANTLSIIVFSRPKTKSSTMNRLLISKFILFVVSRLAIFEPFSPFSLSKGYF